ncbi:MAG: hypothetical protein CR982_02060 [Candidatus Cloacimonadota bacterium]|nr:MAG: hypothetical protein CR982_02060 [Candidatus Cloacimonadota bacterium]PIE78656.1 MAG: hypothetical protein CSA15_06705 [Candidatus Delongbacteria bacterium]
MSIMYKAPSGWESSKLDSLCIKITDGTHKTPDYKDDGVVFISAKNVREGKLDFSDQKYISHEEHELLIKRCKPEADDVMLSKSGSLGNSVVIPKLEFEFSIFESLALMKVKKKKVLPEYLMQIFNSPLAKRYFWSITTGLAVKHLHLGDLKKMPILLPSPPEQEAIIDSLSIWDQAIEKIERLILAKEKRFKWLLRLLISDNKKSKWEKVKLGDISKISKGKQLNVSNMKTDGDYYALNGGVNPSGRTNNWNTEAETITISEGGNSCGYVNYNTERFWSGGHCYSILDLNNNIDKHYLYFYLKMNEPKLMKLRVGSGLPNIQKKDIEKFVIALPSLTEQKEIAQLSLSSQKEINLLKQLVEKYKAQKKGLMQKILTGKWRIKDEIINQYKEV